MRNHIVKIGRFSSTVLITVLSVILSVLITSIIDFSINAKISNISILISIIAPALIAPTITWYMVGLVIEIHHSEQEQRRLATYDFQTGLMSHRSFMDNSHILLMQCKRIKEKFNLAIIDIDNFKAINDTYGHGGGDEVLKSLSVNLRKALRESDTVGRIGGDEFAITFFGTGGDQSIHVLENIRIAIERTVVKYAGKYLKYTVSIGVSGINENSSLELDDILKHSDMALYEAKSSGKNCIVKWQ
ncbi:MAG: GGDEF domain-containing protein [Gammaproteobacteria bacterium]|nr:GGDEF domain-containing protein [Gammaproteobacteria bacterium]